MKKKITKLLMVILFMSCSINLFSQNDDNMIYVNGVIIADKNAPFKFEDGKWVPSENSKIKGELTMIVNLDGNKSTFTFEVTGSEKIGESTYYKCDTDQYFFIENDVYFPFIEDLSYLPYQNLEEAKEAFKYEESKENAWAIWLLSSQEE